MQAKFLDNENLINAIVGTISKPRLSRYYRDAKTNKAQAIELYTWNIKLSQAAYLPINIWEVALRNKINSYLIKKYGQNWPYDENNAIRQLTLSDKNNLIRAKERQQRARQINPVPTSAIVADLSAGFWVSLLSSAYDVPLSWHSQISRIFPYNKDIDRVMAHRICSSIRDLRNRIAHHEPIYHLPIDALAIDLRLLLEGMCQSSASYLDEHCTLSEVMALKPRL